MTYANFPLKKRKLLKRSAPPIVTESQPRKRDHNILTLQGATQPAYKLWPDLDVVPFASTSPISPRRLAHPAIACVIRGRWRSPKKLACPRRFGIRRSKQRSIPSALPIMAND